MNEPKNLIAIREWILKNRPDMAGQIDLLLKTDAAILLLGVGFEAGRQFQKENPDLRLNSPSVYIN